MEFPIRAYLLIGTADVATHVYGEAYHYKNVYRLLYVYKLYCCIINRLSDKLRLIVLVSKVVTVGFNLIKY